MDLDRGSFAALGAAATDLGRFTMTAMEVRAGETVCTDGRIMARVKHPERVVTDTGSDLAKPFLLRAEDAKAMAGNLSKKKRDPECFKRVGLDVEKVNEKPEHATFTVPVAGKRTDVVCDAAEGEFPDVDSVMPSCTEFDAGVVLNIGYLKRLIKIVEDVERAEDHAGDKTTGTLRLKLYGVKPGKFTTAPVRIDAAYGRFSGVQMPISVD